MAYVPPTTGGIFVTDGATQIGIWMDSSDEALGLGDNLVAVDINTGTEFWQSTPYPQATWQTNVTQAGGMEQLMLTYMPQINAALATAFPASVTPPASGATYSAAAFNAMLATS